MLQSATMKIKDPITTIEAARILDVDPSAIRHRIRKGKLKSERVGRDHFVSRLVVESEKRSRELKRDAELTQL